MEINEAEVKRVNDELKKIKENCNKLEIEKQLNLKELNEKCEALKAELGIEVNADNIDSLVESEIETINRELNQNSIILAKALGKDISGMTAGETNTPNVTVTTMNQNTAPVQNVAPAQTILAQTVANNVNTVANSDNVFVDPLSLF